ncbi:hypothetical protein ACK356_14475 [Aeromonas veronii]|uniref:hypothetical protein n=1 Tax=Aeromonas TaxID=642 RepID=UPI0018F1DC72|nr:hypothetical protein [Aeromonas veronii]MBJ7583373.1 hypothetical protein [Aeromonas veronii]MEB5667051.1 hypothetical protein [Aeromonas veronii]HDX8425818.1 hypothetical protein [Aeromonas veronii]
MKNSKRPDNTQLQAWDIENVIPSAVGHIGLVKLLHSPIVAERTIELVNGDIFNQQNKTKQNKNSITASESPQSDILLCECNYEDKPDLRLTSPENPISLEIRHVRQTEPQEPIAIYAVR